MPTKQMDLILYHDPRFYAAFPAAVTICGGAVLVAFRRARDHRWLKGLAMAPGDPAFDSVDHVDSRSEITLLRLDGMLNPVRDPVGLPVDPEAADQDASLLRLRDGRLLLGGFCWYPVPASYGPLIKERGGACLGSADSTGSLFLFWGAYTRTSDDDGRHWRPHRFLPELEGYPAGLPGVRPLYGGALRGRPFETGDGTLLVATYANHPHHGRYTSHLFASADRGETWTYRSVIAEDPEGRTGFAEPALAGLPDGRLIALHRTAGLGDRLATSVSDDGGFTWSAPRTRDLVGHPFDVQPLPDGRLLIVYGYRHAPFGIRARVWDGAGEPGEAPELVIRDDGPSPDLGYPWACVLDDGRILVVYYICGTAGIRHIAGSVLEALPG